MVVVVVDVVDVVVDVVVVDVVVVDVVVVDVDVVLVVLVVVGAGRLQVAMLDMSANDTQRVHVALFNMGYVHTPPQDGTTVAPN